MSVLLHFINVEQNNLKLNPEIDLMVMKQIIQDG